MLSALSAIMDFLIIALCWITIALSIVIYRGRGSRTFLYMAIFAAVQLFIELEVRDSEVGSYAGTVLASLFVNTAWGIIRSVLYAAAAVLLLLILFRVLEKKIPSAWIVLTIVLVLWLLVFPLRKAWTGITYLLYLLPYEIYVVLLAAVGLKSLNRIRERPHFHTIRRLLLCAMILTLLSIGEDAVTTIRVGAWKDMGLPLGAVMKERNFCECVLNILLFGGMSYSGSKILIGALNTEPTEVPIQPPADLPTTVDRFADAIGLSRREKEVLPLLLENKTIGEISETLFISPGTVKSHTHNIYQKAEVTDRGDLIQKASSFLDDTEES